MTRPIETLRLLLEADASTGFPEALRSVVPYSTVEEAKDAVSYVLLRNDMPASIVIPLTRLMVTLIPPVKEFPEEELMTAEEWNARMRGKFEQIVDRSPPDERDAAALRRVMARNPSAARVLKDIEEESDDEGRAGSPHEGPDD